MHHEWAESYSERIEFGVIHSIGIFFDDRLDMTV